MTNNNAVNNVQFLSQIDHLALQDLKVTESIDLLYIMNHQCFSEKISLEFYLKSVTFKKRLPISHPFAHLNHLTSCNINLGSNNGI